VSRTLPRWMREAQRRILAQPGISPDLVCPECARSCYVSDWNVAAGRCHDCLVPRAPFPARDADHFLPPEDE
jgi:hypothetical protein